MSDVLSMQIRHCAHNLLKYHPSHLLADLPPWFVLQIVEHRLLPNVLHHQHYLRLTVNGVQQLDDIWVVDLGQNLDLAIDVFHLLLVKQLVFLIDLENDLLTCVFVCGELDQRVGA